MLEMGPSGRWAINRDIPADPGGSMAIISDERYRSPCMHYNPGVPIYLKSELAMLKKVKKNAPLFRFVQKVKRAFPNARIVHIEPKAAN